MQLWRLHSSVYIQYANVYAPVTLFYQEFTEYLKFTKLIFP